MRKLRIIYFLAILSIGCAGNKKLDLEREICNENLIFKKEFFSNLSILDDYYKNKSKSTNIANDIQLNFEEKLEKLDKIKSDYYKAIRFFSKYSKTNSEYAGNYINQIPYNKYLNYRKVWINWYEKNKCKNLELIE